MPCTDFAVELFLFGDAACTLPISQDRDLFVAKAELPFITLELEILVNTGVTQIYAVYINIGCRHLPKLETCPCFRNIFFKLFQEETCL